MLATFEHEAIALDIPRFDLSKGEFVGIAMMARDFVPFVEKHWPNQRVKAVLVGLAESHLRVGAYNDNYRLGEVVSRDCGVMEDNIPARLIGSDTEADLRTESRDPKVWMPVVANNVRWFYQLWATKSVYRDGKLDYRRWSPSVAYTSGWGPHPRCWVWHHERDTTSNVLVPKGPWVKAGMYLHKALRGVINHDYLNRRNHARTPKDALAWVRNQAENVWGIPEEWCAWDFNEKNLIYFIPEKQPTTPPTAEENWGYPVPNDGR